MNTKHDGGAAFPVPAPQAEGGMSLRDYIAIKIAASDATTEGGWGSNSGVQDEGIASRATLYYRIADAMLAERTK
jgi:hypothetical protein